MNHAMVSIGAFSDYKFLICPQSLQIEVILRGTVLFKSWIFWITSKTEAAHIFSDFL